MGERKSRLRESLFVDVPPYHRFLPPYERYEDPACKGLEEEEWQFPAQIMPIVRDIVSHAGFKIVKGLLRSSEENEVISAGNIWDNLPLVEKDLDAIDFRRLKEAVKINKFPAFIDLNRKDRLWKNFRRMQMFYGKEAFGFHPDTFYLPAEQKQLVARMKRENYENVYIVKLPNNFCGIGACVIKHPSKIPRKKKVHTERSKKVIKEDPIIVQKYLTKPFLINGYKFDFRIYVLITSIAPLRIYLFKDGLVRFATEKFSLAEEDLDNTFIHLTNFTVNRKGDTVNDFPEGCQVNKWSIYELWAYWKKQGRDPSTFWEDVKDVVIKTVLCAHERIAKEVEEKSTSFYNNFNLLGLDIFIDENMKPNLLEVNTIPSLFINQISLDIDTRLKAPLVAEVLNICGHHISTSNGVKHKQDIIDAHLPDYTQKSVAYDHRLYVKKLLSTEKKKQDHFLKQYLNKSNSTPLDVILNKEGLPQLYADGDTNDKGSDEKNDENEEEEEYSEEEDEEEASDENSGKSQSPGPKTVMPQQNGAIKNEGNEKNGGVKQGSSFPILDTLTPCDIRVLVHSEDELTQTETFERIFPSMHTAPYLTYMNRPSYYDLLLAAWEEKYADCPGEGLYRLHDECVAGKHLNVPDSEKKIKTAFKPPAQPKKSYNVPHIFKDK